MEKFILIALFGFFITSLSAQEWTTDYDEAIKTATEKNRNIVLVFQGSDWCAPCIKLEREIWTSEEFKTFASGHFVLLKADFPRKKANQLDKAQQEKNNNLAEKYNSAGNFPFVVVLNANGKVLGETGYQKMTPQEYITLLTEFEK
ncbi:MAG: thiol-disulfide isomerase [Bacteroidetes bacterium GWF2_33_16]|nr:MAG: thiol-disulfide isomerase [Bacteroidetes bacterium GWE2_32_14]OFY05237.1 MAG: thiol-disulfide isomerase [Bacteroidetes bacterium GWF2_33_16]